MTSFPEQDLLSSGVFLLLPRVIVGDLGPPPLLMGFASFLLFLGGGFYVDIFVSRPCRNRAMFFSFFPSHPSPLFFL